MAVEDDLEEMARKELGCKKKTLFAAMAVRLLKIRCQDTTSEG
jgi:hypothetical protein